MNRKEQYVLNALTAGAMLGRVGHDHWILYRISKVPGKPFDKKIVEYPCHKACLRLEEQGVIRPNGSFKGPDGKEHKRYEIVEPIPGRPFTKPVEVAVSV